jgi:hypothetical protein
MANVHQTQERDVCARGRLLEDREVRDAKLLMSQLKDSASPTARLLNSWEHVPLLLMSDEDWDREPLFVIGQTDFMMWPLLPPGSVLRLDPSARKIVEGRFPEFERPIYLIEYNNRFYCCYAQRERDSLILLPHPESPYRTSTRVAFKKARVRGQLTLLFRPLATRLKPSASR